MQKVKNSKKAKKKKKKDDVSRKLRLKHQSNADIKKRKGWGKCKKCKSGNAGDGPAFGQAMGWGKSGK